MTLGEDVSIAVVEFTLGVKVKAALEIISADIEWATIEAGLDKAEVAKAKDSLMEVISHAPEQAKKFAALQVVLAVMSRVSEDVNGINSAARDAKEKGRLPN